MFYAKKGNFMITIKKLGKHKGVIINKSDTK